MFDYENRFSASDLIWSVHRRNFTYHAHLHKSFELLFCLKGELVAVISGSRYLLRQGQAVMIPKNTIHSYVTENTSELYAVLFGENVLPEFSLMVSHRIPVNFVFTVDEILAGLVEESMCKESSTYTLKAMLYCACDKFLAGNQLLQQEKEGVALAVKMLACIQEKFREELTLEQFARDNDYSYAYISKLVKKYFQTTFTELLAHYRVDYAKILLSEGQYTVAQVAMMSGFGSIRSFNRVFVKKVGITPREYRQQKNVRM